MTNILAVSHMFKIYIENFHISIVLCIYLIFYYNMCYTKPRLNLRNKSRCTCYCTCVINKDKHILLAFYTQRLVIQQKCPAFHFNRAENCRCHRLRNVVQLILQCEQSIISYISNPTKSHILRIFSWNSNKYIFILSNGRVAKFTRRFL